jgi:hypothetical protein
MTGAIRLAEPVEPAPFLCSLGPQRAPMICAR